MDNLLNEKPVIEKDFDLYTTLSIFVNRAPKIIDNIAKAAESKNLTEMEELAARLITYSNNAQLTGFTEKLKNLIIAGRENNLATIGKHTNSLKDCFAQMVRLTNMVDT